MGSPMGAVPLALKAMSGKKKTQEPTTPSMFQTIEKANVSDLYRKSYDKEARLQQMRTMGASANPNVVKRMLEIAKTIDPEHFKAMQKAREEAMQAASPSSPRSGMDLARARAFGVRV
mgnify:FL=1